MNCVVERCKKENKYSKRYKNVTEKERKNANVTFFYNTSSVSPF